MTKILTDKDCVSLRCSVPCDTVGDLEISIAIIVLVHCVLYKFTGRFTSAV